jgi:hypothetical protein
MPSKILATGAGAAGGLETLLARLRAEELMDQRQFESGRDFTEKQRQSGLDETFRNKQLDALERQRLAVLEDTKARNADATAARNTDDQRALLATVRPGAMFSEPQRDQFIKDRAAVPDQFAGQAVREPGEPGFGVMAPQYEYQGQFNQGMALQREQRIADTAEFNQKIRALGAQLAERKFQAQQDNQPLESIQLPSGAIVGVPRGVANAMAMGQPYEPSSEMTAAESRMLDDVMAAVNAGGTPIYGKGSAAGPGAGAGIGRTPPGVGRPPVVPGQPPPAPQVGAGVLDMVSATPAPTAGRSPAAPPSELAMGAPPSTPPSTPPPTPAAAAAPSTMPMADAAAPTTAAPSDDIDQMYRERYGNAAPPAAAPPPAAAAPQTGLPGGIPGIARPETAATRNKMITDQELASSLSRMYRMYEGRDEQGNATGARPAKEMIGSLEGRLRGFTGNIPEWLVRDTWQSPQEQQAFENFRAESDRYYNRMIRAITGAAMQANEAERIKAEIPRWDQEPIKWQANYAAQANNFADVAAALAARGLNFDLGPLAGAEAAAARRAAGIPDTGLGDQMPMQGGR